jgi:hypothetical protein
MTERSPAELWKLTLAVIRLKIATVAFVFSVRLRQLAVRRQSALTARVSLFLLAVAERMWQRARLPPPIEGGG